MAKKRTGGGKNTTPRINIGMPADWHAVLRRLAARSKQPVLWYLIDLAAREAATVGIETPPVPWEEENPKPAE